MVFAGKTKLSLTLLEGAEYSTHMFSKRELLEDSELEDVDDEELDDEELESIELDELLWLLELEFDELLELLEL